MNLTFQEAAHILKISPATVKNWLKAGVLRSTRLSHVKQTEQQIHRGALKRLQKGANKHQSRKIHTHAELLFNKENAVALRPLIERYKKQKKELMLAVYLRQLVTSKLAAYQNNKFVLKAALKKELAAWNISISSAKLLSIYKEVESVRGDFSDNLLSYIHQSLNETSAKQDLGAYYTPASAVEKALKSVTRPGSVCDPCCGSGNFLVQAYLRMKKHKWPAAEASVFGYDCDPLAVLLARANLTLASLNRIDVLRAIQLRDFLIEKPLEEFSYIVTNPPWGSYPEKKHTIGLQKKFGLQKTRDSFSFFLLTSLQTMKHNGSGHFILPVSFLNVAAHAELRKNLFSNWTVTRIELLTEKFSGVMTASVLVSVHNRRPESGHEMEISSNAECQVLNSDIIKSRGCVIPLNNDSTSLQVLREVETASSSTLKKQSLWGLGLVTGHNEKYLFSSAGAGRVPVITGKQVFRFKQPKANAFCAADTSLFQQAAPVSIYRAEKKLIYRFIAKELVFSIDNERLFTLNSANILIPQSDLYSCEFLCGLFNSKLGQYYFTKKHSSIKVLRSHLENFPLPAFDERIFSEVEACVQRLKKGIDPVTVSRLDKLIVKAYRLSKSSEAAVLGYQMNEAFN